MRASASGTASGAEQLGQRGQELAVSSAEVVGSFRQRLSKLASVFLPWRETLDVDADHPIEKGASFSRGDFRKIEFPHRREVLARPSLIVEHRYCRRIDALRRDVRPVPLRNPSQHLLSQLFTVAVLWRSNCIRPTVQNFRDGTPDLLERRKGTVTERLTLAQHRTRRLPFPAFRYSGARNTHCWPPTL